MSISHNANKRVKKLFSEIKSIADQPLTEPATTLNTDVNLPMEYVGDLAPQTDTQKYQREIELLNARIMNWKRFLTKLELARKAEGLNLPLELLNQLPASEKRRLRPLPCCMKRNRLVMFSATTI